MSDGKRGTLADFVARLGDPHALCVCGHYEMNHAGYIDMNSACNQTYCRCTTYTRAVPDAEGAD